MCGIAGFFVNGQAEEARGTLQRMTDSLRHRGPDDEGFYVDAQIALGARRLRIIDLETGQQPVANDDGFVFGSALRALLVHPSVPAVLSLESLSRYLAFEYVPAPSSIVAGVQKLLPGQLLTVSPGGKPTVQRYWDLDFRPDGSVSEREWADRLYQQLEASVRRRMISDVPLGIFLSGGIDSGAIVALAARANGRRPLKTFTIGFPDATFDERPSARLIAQHCGAEHEETVFSPHDMLALLEEVGGLLDEPL